MDEHEPEPEQKPITPQLRELFAELEAWLEQQPDEHLAGHALVPATRLVLKDIPGLDLERYDEEAKIFILATPIWDRTLLRFQHDATYWVAQRLLMSENHEPELERAAELLTSMKAAIADRADLLEQEGYPRIAQSFRALLDESAGGEPPADLIWKGIALRIAEPYLADPVNVVPFATPSASQPPSDPPEPEPE